MTGLASRYELGDARSATSEELGAIMAISAAVAEGDELGDTLGRIARAAAQLVSSQAAAIILRESVSETGLAVAGSYGLSPEYTEHLNRRHPLEVGKGPSGLAVERGSPVAIADVLETPMFAPWRDLAIREHYRSLVSVPLRRGTTIGVLNAYRSEPGEWTQREVDVLSLLAAHAAIAIQTAHLLDDSRRQVNGLSLMVRSLRAQTHEHSNRLHAIYGMLALGETVEARRLVASVEEGYHSLYGNVTARIENATLAGFLVAEAAIARESGIDLFLDRRSRLQDLPHQLSDLDAITVVGNLVHNAVEAVAAMPRRRRRVSVRIIEQPGKTSFRVRDWGPGVAPEDVEEMFKRDCSTKPGHSGIGLTLVGNVARRCRGAIDVEHPRGGGLSVTVAFRS
jgi:GAF domain-containing protein/anti-sigma regulatory factor (Ser/Thr protein kinase)